MSGKRLTNNFVNQTPPFTFQQVDTELSLDKVVCAKIGWYNGGSHFMVIHGCKNADGVTYYNIDDPFHGKSEIMESGFLTAYRGAGAWTHSYSTTLNHV